MLGNIIRGLGREWLIIGLLVAFLGILHDPAMYERARQKKIKSTLTVFTVIYFVSLAYSFI